MRVTDLAKELGLTEEIILTKLKSLKLKAKGGDQELNSVVISVLKTELKGMIGKFPPSKLETASKADKAVKPKEELSSKKKLAGVEKAEKPKKAEKKKEESKAVKAKDQKKKILEKPKGEESKIKPPIKKVAETKAKEVKKGSSKEPVETAKPVSAPSAGTPAKEKIRVPEPKEIKPVVQQPLTTHPKTVTPPPVHVSKPFRPVFTPKPKFHEKGAAPEVKVPIVEKPKGPAVELELQLPISVKDFSVKIQQKPSVVLKKLLDMGVFATINQSLDEELVKKLALEFNFLITKGKTIEETLIEFHKVEEEDESLLKPRPPVVTFMGHVDHGKTSLLDRIRKTRVADGEHGGITQHIGAYSVKLPKGKITFLDTPGHEAFTAMRARGAHITDIVVLVVAADEGIMPQTEEAINHARAANVPIVVALNKIDKRNAEPDRVKKELSEHGLSPEDWGGKTIVVGVSATTGEGVDRLLEMILLEAEMLELKANYEKKASGIIVEALLTQGRGPVATLIVQNGTLKEGDAIVVGPHMARIKAMFDDFERPIKEAGPASAAEILGLSGVPEAGERFYVVEDERKAKEIAFKRQEQVRTDKFSSAGPKITLEDLYAQIKEGKIKELNIILKADVQGSLEALRDSLLKISTEEVQLKFIHMGVGLVNSSDVLLADASNAIIIAFNIDIDPRAKVELEKKQIDVRTYRIIYDAINDIKNALAGLLEPKTRKKFMGRIEVRNVFKLSKSGLVAGCYVVKGKVPRKVNIDVVRNGQVVFSGTLSSLKRFKDDVKDVSEGFECGLTIQGFNDYQVGDVVEAFELERIARTL